MDVSNLLVEVFMKVMNGSVMTLEEDTIFVFGCSIADSRMKVPRYRSSPAS